MGNSGDTGESIQDLIRSIPIWDPGEIRAIEKLSGGWTNRNYRVVLSGHSCVLRIFSETSGRLGINRRREHEISQLAAEAGIAPQVMYWSETDGILITRYIEGEVLSPEAAAQPENVRRLASTLREIHSLPAVGAVFCPFEWAKRWIETACGLGVEIPAEYQWIPARIQTVKEATHTQTLPACLCHNDFVRSNIIDNGRLWVIDWEYAGVGNPLFDLATVAMNWQATAESEALLLRCYFGRSDAPHVSALAPWKWAFDHMNAAFYLLQKAASKDGLDYEYGLTHHLARLARSLTTEKSP